MKSSSIIGFLAAFGVAGVASLFAASSAARLIETQTTDEISLQLSVNGYEYVDVQADGLQVVLDGEAPDEATRFQIVSLAGTIVDAARVIDDLSVADAADLAPPRFSVEVLRNDAGISLIGLVPVTMDRETSVARLQTAVGDVVITDFLQVADYPKPANWDLAIAYALDAVELLPRAKVSVDAERIAIEAIADSLDERQSWRSTLERRQPEGLEITVDISAPRPVITPFTLRFLIDDRGPRFDVCTADTEVSARRIRAAAAEAGVQGTPPCVLGLGTPTATWGTATSLAIKALAELGQGTLTFSDADISLIAAEGTDPSLFSTVTEDLEANLPEVFSLTSVLTRPAQIEEEVAQEFLATLSPEGEVQLRGVVADSLAKDAIESFARAQFDASQIYSAARIYSELPRGWSVRTMAGLEALGELHNGSVEVYPTSILLRGQTGDEAGPTRVSQILSERLGEGQAFEIDVAYVEALDPFASLLDPGECIASITKVTDAAKISFEPGSANLDVPSQETIDTIAAILEDCLELEIEIGGHTDSQGREVMNQALSQDRANAVLTALLAKRVTTARFTAKGYGESEPIADNGTEAGREANRRIVFKLLEEEPEVNVTDAEAEEAAPDEATEDGESTADE